MNQELLLRGIENLVKMKRIGTRGQGSIDVFAALLIAAVLFFSLYQFYENASVATSWASITILFSFALVTSCWLNCHRNPKQRHVDEAFCRT